MRSANVKLCVAAALAAIAFAACSSSSKPSSSPATSPPTEAPTAAPSGSTGATGASGSKGTFTVAVATKTVDGESESILVDSKGRTLYVDENDKPGQPACTGACLQAWPPVPATAKKVTVGPGVTASKFTTVTAADGTKQLAVNGSPLYLWMNDSTPADATGQDVNGFYVVQANGEKYDPGASDES
jgi:predicted lipoprotein with Yx(FWY)xxD motif